MRGGARRIRIELDPIKKLRRGKHDADDVLQCSCVIEHLAESLLVPAQKIGNLSFLERSTISLESEARDDLFGACSIVRARRLAGDDAGAERRLGKNIRRNGVG